MHEADLEDDRFDAPEAPGLDVALRGLWMVRDDVTVLALTGPLFDGLYEYFRRATLLDRPLLSDLFPQTECDAPACRRPPPDGPHRPR